MPCHFVGLKPKVHISKVNWVEYLSTLFQEPLPLYVFSLRTDCQLSREWLSVFAAGTATCSQSCAAAQSGAAEQALCHPAQSPAERWQSTRLASSKLANAQPCLLSVACGKAPFWWNSIRTGRSLKFAVDHGLQTIMWRLKYWALVVQCRAERPRMCIISLASQDTKLSARNSWGR
jgi:hypothetical protein